MVKKPPGSVAAERTESVPREIGTSAAAPEPSHTSLAESVYFDDRPTVCMAQCAESGFSGVQVPVCAGADVEGPPCLCCRSDGVPVIDGVADTDWVELGDTRVRVKVRVEPNDRQLEWVRGQLFS